MSVVTPRRTPIMAPKTDVDRPVHHLRPVLTVLAFLVPMVWLTVYYYDQTQPAPFVPTNILVLALLNVDIILLVVLVLLLSRNLVKAYFERRQKLLGSGFRSKLIAAFVGFTLIPSLLLVGLASGLLSQSIDNWFGQEVEHALKDSRDVAQAHRRGHEAVTVNSAKAISREIYADELLSSEHRETLALAMQRKRMEYGVSGVEVYAAPKQLLTRSVDPKIPLAVLDAPEDKLVENALASGEVKSFQFIETGDLIRAAVPIQKLAEGTQAVASGDLNFRIKVKATDEIGVLVDSFNRMTRDLQASKAQLERANISLQQSNVELDRRRAYTETVLDNIGSGVVSVDAAGRITTFNHSAERILAQKAAAWQEVAQRIAHEIKNPLTPIQLSAERLRKKFLEGAPDFNDIVDQSTRTIVNEVSGLKRMVDEFSNYARMPVPVMERQSLHATINDVVMLYKGAHRDIEFVTDLDEHLPPIMMDREQMKRVFVNLFDNAIQAMNDKGRLSVTTRQQARDGKVVIEVADEGIGIQPGDQENLFLPYFSKKKTGTGLGLAIVHRIISDHNGRIRAANHVPKGAIFTIELPV